MSLLNPLLIRTGVLHDVSKPVALAPGLPWFKGVSWMFLLANVLIPLLLIIILAFFMKHRYLKKQERLSMESNDSTQSDYQRSI